MISCQPDGVGILQETVSNAVMMIQGATARDPTASKAGGVSIFFLPSAQRADTAYALGVWRIVLPTLSCIVDSPHARSIHGVRQCTDDTKFPPYMTIVPSGTPLNPNVHEMKDFRVAKLSRNAHKGSIHLPVVDPMKYKFLRDFIDGSIIDVGKIIRRLKLCASDNRVSCALEVVMSKSPQLQGHSVFSFTDKGLIKSRSPIIRHAAIACGLHQESSAVLPSWLQDKFEWSVICERKKKLSNALMKRLNNTQLIPTVESLITMPRDKIKAVDVAFFSFPCINETVLRHGTDAQYDDTKSGMLFRESHLQVADALNYPKIICSELVSPHPENFNHHLQVEDMMTDPKRQDCNSYSQTDCSAVVNAAFFSGCVSQPRWIRVFRLKMCGSIRNFDPRMFETQHAQPILSVIRSHTGNFKEKDVVYRVTDIARDIYSAQYRSVMQNWQASSPLHFHFSDNAYAVALFRNIPSKRYKISLSLQEAKVNLETVGGQFLFHLGYNACKKIGCSSADFEVFFSLDKDGHMITEDGALDIWGRARLIDRKTSLIFDAHAGFRIIIIAYETTDSCDAVQIAAQLNELVPLFLSPSNGKIVVKDSRGLLLRTPIAHYLGYLRHGSEAKGFKVYNYTGPIGVITSHPNAWILLPNGCIKRLSPDECVDAKELASSRDILDNLDEKEFRLAVSNALTGGFTVLVHKVIHHLYHQRDEFLLDLPGNNQPNYANCVSLVHRVMITLNLSEAGSHSHLATAICYKAAAIYEDNRLYTKELHDTLDHTVLPLQDDSDDEATTDTSTKPILGLHNKFHDIESTKGRYLPEFPESQYEPMKESSSPEFQRRRFAATQLIKAYGCGPQLFDYLVGRSPNILGKKFGEYVNRLAPGDWRYCNFPEFSKEYISAQVIKKSRARYSPHYSELEVHFSPGQCWYLDAKDLTEYVLDGFRHVFIATDLITGYWIMYPVKDLTTKTVLSLITFLRNTISSRFGQCVKLLLWDHFSTFFADKVKAFSASVGIELSPFPPGLKNRNRVEQEISILSKKLRYFSSWTRNVRIQGKRVKASRYLAHMCMSAATSRNNCVSQTFYRNTGQICTYLEAISSGKERTVDHYQFFLPIMCNVPNDMKQLRPSDSFNVPAYYLSSAHYNPLKVVAGLSTHRGGLREPVTAIVVLAHSGKVVNVGTFVPFTTTKYGRRYCLENNLAPPTCLQDLSDCHPGLKPRYNSSSFSAADSSDDEDNYNSKALTKENARPIDDSLIDSMLEPGESHLHASPPDDLSADLDNLQTDDGGQDDQEDHMSFGDAGDDHSDSPDSGADLDGDTSENASDDDRSGDNSSEDESDESDDGGARVPRVRRPPPANPPGTVHPGGGLKRWDANLLEQIYALARPGTVILDSLMLLTAAFAPSVWFANCITRAMDKYDQGNHQNVFLDSLAQGMELNDPDLHNINFVQADGALDSDIAGSHASAAKALWGSASDAPTTSQYFAIKHGKLMCLDTSAKHCSPSKGHEFGRNLDLDEPIFDAFMTYGLCDRDIEHDPTYGLGTTNHTMKNIQVVLSIDPGLMEKHVTVPLKHEDIIYEETIIADLIDEDRDQRVSYFRAIQDEMSALCALNFAEIVIIPDDRDPISTRFVLKVKRKADGAYWKHKARFVVRGFMQRIGLDYYTTASPMAALASCRLVLSTAVKRRLKCHHVDIPNAFIQSSSERDLYISLPRGLKLDDHKVAKLLQKANLVPTERNKNRVGLRLLKALYGLKQAPLLWNLRIDKFLKSLGFKRQTADACLYQFTEVINGETKFVMLTLSVDDLLITGDHTEKIEHLKPALNKEFAIDINGELKECQWDDHVESFLGINVTGRTEDGFIQLSVPHKIDGLIKDVETAIEGKVYTLKQLSNTFQCASKDNSRLWNYVKTNFSRIIGTCIYMSITCRPDISTQVSKAARGMHDPSDTHIVWAIQLLKYLNGTRERALTYTCKNSAVSQLLDQYSKTDLAEVTADIQASPCVAFSDANWADSTDGELRSTSGFCVYVFGNLVSWHTKRQTLTAASTMQAELIAAATCADECKWFHNIFASSEEIFGPLASIPLLVDNQAALSTANHPLTTPKSKFVSLRDFRIRDYQNEGIVRPAWIPGKINPADGFTKLLGTHLSQQFTTLLGMRDRPVDDKEIIKTISAACHDLRIGVENPQFAPCKSYCSLAAYTLLS